jgi:hypothetical protein
MQSNASRALTAAVQTLCTNHGKDSLSLSVRLFLCPENKRAILRLTHQGTVAVESLIVRLLGGGCAPMIDLASRLIQSLSDDLLNVSLR